MKPHEERVVKEKEELSERLTKLNKFCESKTFNTLPDADRFLLLVQSDIMTDYLEVLEQRIERFNLV